MSMCGASLIRYLLGHISYILVFHDQLCILKKHSCLKELMFKKNAYVYLIHVARRRWNFNNCGTVFSSTYLIARGTTALYIWFCKSTTKFNINVPMCNSFLLWLLASSVESDVKIIKKIFILLFSLNEK